MAGFIARAQAILANLQSKDVVVPDSAFAAKMMRAAAYSGGDRWVRFLQSDDNRVSANTPTERTVINPDNYEDRLDIGLWTYATRTFTPLSNADTIKLASQFYLRSLRQIHADMLMHYRVALQIVSAEDIGRTPSEVEVASRTAAYQEAAMHLGDSSLDMDS